MGRDENTDIKFWSPKVSRELIELITGPNITNTQLSSSSSSPASTSAVGDKTLLIIRICSRAKTIINGKTYKLLSKDSKPEEIDFTNETKLKIETISQIDKQTGQIITQDTPLFIEWVPLRLYISSNDKYDQIHYKTIIKNHGIDIQIVDNVMDATHYYYDNDIINIEQEEQKNEFKLAIIKGIPILNSQWLQMVLGHEHDNEHYRNTTSVKDWLLDIDYPKYLPNNDYVPKNNRLKLFGDIKLVSLEKIDWLETIIIDFTLLIQQEGDPKNQDYLQSKIGDNQFILIASTPMTTTMNRHNFQTITMDQLWQSIKTNSILDLPKNSLKQLKRTSTTMLSTDKSAATATTSPEVVAPPGRKRRKYEKVDRLHFFSLATAPTTRDSSPKVSILDTNNKSISPESTSQKNTSGDNDSITQEITQLSDPIKKIPTLEQKRKVLNSSQTINLNQNDVLISSNDSNLSIPLPANQLALQSKLNSKSQKSSLNSGSNSSSINTEEENPSIGFKRKNKDKDDDVIVDRKSFKIPKITPKVSLVDAVLKVQELNKPQNFESDFEINENLKNLAIVEVVELVNRRNRNRNRNKGTDGVGNVESRYTGRKNFKKFKKNAPSSNNNRRRIGLYTVEDNLEEEEDEDEEEDGDHNDTTRDDNYYEVYF